MGRRMTGAEVRSAITTNGIVALGIDDLTVNDLSRISWSGNPAHIRSVAERLEAVARLEAEYLAVRAPDGSPIAKCLIDYSLADAEAEIAQLAVHPDLQGLGIGSYLVAAAERRIHERGKRWSVIGVDVAESRPRALYERLGYEFIRHEQHCWEVEDVAGQVSTYHADVVLLRKRVGP